MLLHFCNITPPCVTCRYYKTDIKGASNGKLAGKTLAIKDTVAVAGVPMMNGSSLMEGFVPDYDAPVVTRILDAGYLFTQSHQLWLETVLYIKTMSDCTLLTGGCIKGKSACENLCDSGNSFTCSTGPVLNYHDKTRSAGGSSSGSATLVRI